MVEHSNDLPTRCRVCTIVADFKWLKWRFEEGRPLTLHAYSSCQYLYMGCTVQNSMQAERDLLASCYTPKIIRVNMCGEGSGRKRSMLRGWAKHQQQQLGAFWMNMFQSQVNDLFVIPPSDLFYHPSLSAHLSYKVY